MPGTSFRKKRFKAWRISRCHTETSRANYEKYREAWNLLDSDPVGGHIDSIQACAEEFSSDWANEDGGSYADDRRFLLIFLSLPQGSLIVHSFCTRAKCFSVAARDDLPQSGFTENVGPSKACRTMIAAKLAADRQFSRVNCRGKSETRVSACWLPGHCGLLHCPLFELGWAAGYRRGCRGRFSESPFLQP